MAVLTKAKSISSPIYGGWQTSVARWISEIGSPPLTGLATLLLIGFVLATGHAWQWIGFYLICTILLPCAYVIWLVRRGHATDFHLPIREERVRPMLFAAVTVLAAWGVVQWAPAPPALKMLATINCVQALVFFLITLRWKISLHCAAAATMAQLAFAFLGVIALPVSVSVPLIAWSRVYLKRHTLAQTIGGACLGVAIVTPALFLYSL